MTDLTELIEERKKNLAYFEKQIFLLENSDLSKEEIESLSEKFTVRITELKDLLDMNYKQLKQDEKDAVFYSDPFGMWKVTTEGDDEGRSTEDLGTYVGYLDFIAYHLAGRELYSLHFRKLPMKPFYLNVMERPEPYSIMGQLQVSVVLDIDSGTWDNKEDRLNFFEKLLINRNHVNAVDNNYYASVKLIIDPNNPPIRSTGDLLFISKES